MLIVILFCGTVAAAMVGLNKNADKYSEFYNVGYQITNRVMSMRRGLQIIVKDLTFVTIEEDADKVETYLDDMEKELNLMQENATWLFANFQGDSTLLDDFSADITSAVEMQEAVIELANTDMPRAQEMLLNEYQPLVEKAVNTLIEISNVAESEAEANYLATVDLQDMLVIVQLAMAGGALVITLLLSTYLTRSIVRPIRALETAADKIVSGDFDIDVTYKSKDEMGSLAESFRNMAAIHT